MNRNSLNANKFILNIQVGETEDGILKQVQDDSDIFIGVPGRSEWIGSMIPQVVDIDFKQTDSVLEALILESNLIKKHQPKYNTLEKDDKSFAYFVITKEEFPRVLILRKTDIEKPIRNYETKTNLRTDAKIQKEEQTNAKRKKENSSKLFGNWKLEIGNFYAYGPYTSKQQMQIALKIIRRIFPFHAGKQKTEKGCLDFQLGLCPGPYAGAISKEDYKKNIDGIKMILTGKKKRLLSGLEKEMKILAKKNEFEKAAEVRNKIFALQHIRDIALISKDFEAGLNSKKLMANKLTPARIEAYDISNISGTDAVGSMVVFEGSEPNKNQYRKFKIKTVEGSNDVAMMKEVLLRRFKNDWAMPDLILLDGGQGHVNMADKLLRQDLGLDVAIVGVAKGPTRKNLKLQMSNSKQNAIYNISNTSEINSHNFDNKIENILQDKLLIKQIMDEAHRFAITFHRKLRGKSFL
ncbi:MAG: hypothetical protein HGA61_01270 [Candidatus Moranbacteria bacterium]|nr:hypothetical protein [Candidatus Moranbacteria bacterium]